MTAGRDAEYITFLEVYVLLVQQLFDKLSIPSPVLAVLAVKSIVFVDPIKVNLRACFINSTVHSAVKLSCCPLSV